MNLSKGGKMDTRTRLRNKKRTQLKQKYTAYYEMYCKVGKKEYRTKFRDLKAQLDELRREEIEYARPTLH